MTLAQQIERARLLRIAKTPGLSPFEYEDAGRRLRALDEQVDPTCVHCAQKTSTHAQPICPIVASFRNRGGGRDVFPTETQAAKVRELIAKERADEERKARRDALAAAQTKLF